MKLLITGGCGFIGTNFIKYMLSKYDDIGIVNIDAISYAANPRNHADALKDKRYKFVKADLVYDTLSGLIPDDTDYAVHFAAESHVDRSIDKPLTFIENNILGTANLIEALRSRDMHWIHQRFRSLVGNALIPLRKAFIKQSCGMSIILITGMYNPAILSS